MSHNVNIIGAKIPNMALLQQAAAELIREGLQAEFVAGPGSTMRGWQGQTERVDAVLKLKNYNYDVGFNLNKDGTVTPRMESMVRQYDGLSPTKGSKTLSGAACPIQGPEVFIGRLLQRVNVITAERAAASDGHITSRQVMPDGVINVVAVRS